MATRASMKLAFVMLASVLLVSAQCQRRVQMSQDALYRRIEQRFISGDLSGAEAEAALFPKLIHTSDPIWRSRFRLQQARIRIYQGRPDAIALLTEQLPANAADRGLELKRSSLLAIAYRRTGEFARADQLLAQAEKECPSEISCADVRLSQGLINLEKGQLTEAEHDFELGLASARTLGDSFQQTQAWANLGVVSEREEQYDAALDRFSQSSAIAGAIGARLLLEKATGNAGWAFYKLGDYKRALLNSQRAEQQAALLGASIDQVEWLNNAGLSQFRLGDFSAARSSYQQSYALAQSLKNSEEIGDALLALAYLSLESGDLADALNKSREVEHIAVEEGDPEDALEPTLIEASVLARQGQTAAAQGKLLALEQKSAGVQSIRWEIENALAGLYASAGDSAAADTWFRRAIVTFRTQRSSLQSVESRLPFFENGSSLYLGFMEQLIREGKQDDALEVLDQSRAETLAEGLGIASRSTERLNPQELARRLHGTILVYCLRPGVSYLWAIGPAHSGFFRLPGREAILPLVAAHTQAILAAKDLLVQPNAPGEALYRDLVQPAAALLAPHSKVFVIADDSLNALNFETLIPLGAEPHYWIEDADIVNARSISLLAASGPRQQSKKGAGRLLLVGDPVYTHPEDAKLTQAAEEVSRVAGHFSPERRLVLTGAEATPAAYQRSHPESFAYIHFVAHASASEIDPLDSSVILSAAPEAAGAYKLYARSILDQRLIADLVTISGCYGSGVRSYSGEGLVGLAWAFLHTGSHQVIGALWQVSDASTPQLMGELYDSLSAGNLPDIALRSAKLAMIHRGGVFRKPFYWAAFQLYSGA